MENSNVVKENLETLFENLQKFLKSETVIGEPIVIGETTLVPIISVMFGCGTGGGRGVDGKGNDGTGSGLGSAARIIPNAIVVIKDGEVNMLPVKNKSNLDNLLNMVPEIMEKIKCCKKEEKCKEE
jgi:uncharacterized spore protein YtfJ